MSYFFESIQGFQLMVIYGWPEKDLECLLEKGFKVIARREERESISRAIRERNYVCFEGSWMYENTEFWVAISQISHRLIRKNKKASLLLKRVILTTYKRKESPKVKEELFSMALDIFRRAHIQRIEVSAQALQRDVDFLQLLIRSNLAFA